MIKTEEKTSAQEAKLRDKRMDVYDARMNRYGHYSVKKRRAGARSPILDEIIRMGGKLASDYEERMGPPSDACEIVVLTDAPRVASAESVSSDPVNTKLIDSESLHESKPDKFTKRTEYIRNYMRERRAKEREVK